MYFDEIDMLEGLPKLENISEVVLDGGYFSIILKTGEVKNLFMIVESITRGEFEQITRYLVKRINKLHYNEEIV